MTSENASPTGKPPSTADDFIAKGWANHVNGEHADSETNFRRALVIDPQSAEAYYGLAMTLKSLQQFQPALEAFEKVVELINSEQMKEDPLRASMLRSLAITQTGFIHKQMGANS
jgi:tetratricopeptide (TPR) repeat protein